MHLMEWIVPLLIVAVGLTTWARRLGFPYPAFLALGGAALAISPIGPTFTLEPDLALALFVAPVLLDAAYDASLRDLRENWVPIVCLVIAAVMLTTLLVACVARLMLPDLPWAAAVALGAIVAPPDATAATAILRQVRLPFRMAVILEGESLLNDASALFILRLALGAVAAGSFNIGSLTVAFTLVVPASLLAGWIAARVSSYVMGWFEDPPSSIIVQFALTFALWILADKLQLSPVLTIVGYAVIVSQRGARRFGARLRVPAFAVWETCTFMLNILAFVLIGLQLRPILDAMKGDALAFSFGFAIVVLMACIFARFIWVMTYNVLMRRDIARRGYHYRRSATPPNARGGLVMGWCGMRGIVTLAAAFSLPDGRFGEPAFPHRDLMLLTAFIVVLGTLVLQGLTLKPLLLWADLRDDDPVGREIGRARTDVVRAAIAALDEQTGDAADALRLEYKAILTQAEAHPEGFAPATTRQDEMRLRTIEASRTRLHDMRRSGDIGNEAFSRIEAELDQAEMHAREI